jgi:excisionase family DNA binding protein
VIEGSNFTIEEVAPYIKRSKGAVRNLVMRRKIPFRKREGRIYFLKDEIDAWIREAPGVSLEEIINGE